MKALMELNTWANMCGYFFNCCLTPGYEDKPCVNNGYNCSHPEAEKDEGIGCCFAHSCPTKEYSSDGIACQEYGVDCEDCADENCECFDDMIVCEIPEERFDDRYMYRKSMLNWEGEGK